MTALASRLAAAASAGGSCSAAVEETLTAGEAVTEPDVRALESLYDEAYRAACGRGRDSVPPAGAAGRFRDLHSALAQAYEAWDGTSPAYGFIERLDRAAAVRHAAERAGQP